nr:hypothetical protein CFP56_10171 [Quercus suber]
MESMAAIHNCETCSLFRCPDSPRLLSSTAAASPNAIPSISKLRSSSVMVRLDLNHDWHSSMFGSSLLRGSFHSSSRSITGRGIPSEKESDQSSQLRD